MTESDSGSVLSDDHFTKPHSPNYLPTAQSGLAQPLSQFVYTLAVDSLALFNTHELLKHGSVLAANLIP